jgi:hypothetical protein
LRCKLRTYRYYFTSDTLVLICVIVVYCYIRRSEAKKKLWCTIYSITYLRNTVFAFGDLKVCHIIKQYIRNICRPPRIHQWHLKTTSWHYLLHSPSSALVAILGLLVIHEYALKQKFLFSACSCLLTNQKTWSLNVQSGKDKKERMGQLKWHAATRESYNIHINYFPFNILWDTCICHTKVLISYQVIDLNDVYTLYHAQFF